MVWLCAVAGLLAMVALMLFRGWHGWRMVHGWATWLVLLTAVGLMLVGAAVLYRTRPLAKDAQGSHHMDTIPHSDSSVVVPDPQAEPLFGPRGHRQNGQVHRDTKYYGP